MIEESKKWGFFFSAIRGVWGKEKAVATKILSVKAYQSHITPVFNLSSRVHYHTITEDVKRDDVIIGEGIA